MLLKHDSLQPRGTFWFFSAMSILGFIYAWLVLPETSRKGLEESNRLYGRERMDTEPSSEEAHGRLEMVEAGK